VPSPHRRAITSTGRSDEWGKTAPLPELADATLKTRIAELVALHRAGLEQLLVDELGLAVGVRRTCALALVA
jgi:hypothetical protein